MEGVLNLVDLARSEQDSKPRNLDDMLNLLAPKEDKRKNSQYLLRSYIEDNRKTKWCPAPGCEYAVEYAVGSEGYDVSCLCSFNFCWNRKLTVQ
ncbi:hypothetical protein NL676_019316 [Syzygium grande]|nr:hypothetical protein NL676_019316 [Syzygium grande]